MSRAIFKKQSCSASPAVDQIKLSHLWKLFSTSGSQLASPVAPVSHLWELFSFSRQSIRLSHCTSGRRSAYPGSQLASPIAPVSHLWELFSFSRQSIRSSRCISAADRIKTLHFRETFSTSGSRSDEAATPPGVVQHLRQSIRLKRCISAADRMKPLHFRQSIR